MTNRMERRKHPRHRVSVRSRISEGAISSECDTVDLSANGLSCCLERPLNVFTKVKITLMVPADSKNHSANTLKPVVCEGVVVRSERDDASDADRYQTAIFFNHIEADAMELIRRYVASHKH